MILSNRSIKCSINNRPTNHVKLVSSSTSSVYRRLVVTVKLYQDITCINALPQNTHKNDFGEPLCTYQLYCHLLGCIGNIFGSLNLLQTCRPATSMVKITNHSHQVFSCEITCTLENPWWVDSLSLSLSLSLLVDRMQHTWFMMLH